MITFADEDLGTLAEYDPLTKLANIDHFATCSTCGTEQRPDTIYRSCGKIMPNIKQEAQHQVLKNAKDNNDETQASKDFQWKAGLVRAAREAAPKNQRRDNWRMQIESVPGSWKSKTVPIAVANTVNTTTQ